MLSQPHPFPFPDLILCCRRSAGSGFLAPKPPLNSRGAQSQLLGVRRATEIIRCSSVLPADYESHGHHAGGLRTQLSKDQFQHRVGEYLGGLAFAKNFQRILSGLICRPLSTQQLLSSQALLYFALSKNPAVCERAVRRIERLGDFIISYFLSEVRHKEPSTLSCIPEHPATQGCLRGKPGCT